MHVQLLSAILMVESRRDAGPQKMPRHTCYSQQMLLITGEITALGEGCCCLHSCWMRALVESDTDTNFAQLFHDLHRWVLRNFSACFMLNFVLYWDKSEIRCWDMGRVLQCSEAACPCTCMLGLFKLQLSVCSLFQAGVQVLELVIISRCQYRKKLPMSN